MSRTLAAWRGEVVRCATAAVRLEAATVRRSQRLLGAVLGGWRAHVVAMSSGRQALLRAMAAVRSSWLASALALWRGAVVAALRRGVQASGFRRTALPLCC
jgi:hypothetical protein